MTERLTIRQLPAVVKRQIPTARIPVQLEEACKKLAECRTIDEAKYWDTAADALAAWAHIWKNDQASVEAKKLKLHAYRRLSELAEEIQPGGPRKKPPGKSGFVGACPGPKSLLLEHGIPAHQATVIRGIGSLSSKKFDEAVGQRKPMSPRALYETAVLKNPARSILLGRINLLRCKLRDHDPVETARSLSPAETSTARFCAIEVSEWLDTFEQHLPKK